MGLNLGQVVKQNSLDAVVTRNNNQLPAVTAMAVFENDLLETRAAAASAQVMDGNTLAAVVTGTNSNISVYYPPATLDRVYYNNSYRYKLRSPGGYVGIRG